ncbi:MAG: site-2 protease family protein [Eubacteriales bacterium]|nr:site-2 protease family protein [Eubacteriales bacterium]MDD4710289.1 site-2 protease family protein [Eubacteriales bacterium]
MTVIYVLLALLMFGIMITVHEAGHFFAARLTGIPVKEFAIGFGPSILRWNSKKHETKFFLRAIPMGGYCMFYAEDDIKGEEKDDPRAFGKYSVGKRLITIVMGAVMNIVLAFVAATLFFALSGVPTVTGAYETVVQSVNESSPAQAAGMQLADKITAVNGVPVTDNLSALLDRFGEASDEPVLITVARGTELTELTATPLKSEDTGHYMLGITVNVGAPVVWEKGSVGEVISSAYNVCVNAAKSVVTAFRNLIFRGEGAGEVAGVVGVTQMIVEETRQGQLQGYLSMMIFISINLGIVNLFPFPGLDGSRLLFLVIEALRGKPVKKEAYVHAFGMILLVGLMLLITMQDILRMF